MTASKLCRNFQTVVILGLGGSEEIDARHDARRLRETIFGIDYKSSQLQILTNNSSLFGALRGTSADEDLSKSIKSLINSLLHQPCDKISLVFFAHSHGAKMLVKNINEFEKDISEEDAKEIRNKMAVVTLGGVAFANPDLAKVVLNVDCENDFRSKTGALVLKGTHDEQFLKIGPVENGECKCCNRRYAEEGDLHEPVAQIQPTGRAWMTYLWKIPQVLGMVSHSTKSDGHFISEYLACRTWRIKLRQELGVGLNQTCSCMSEDPDSDSTDA